MTRVRSGQRVVHLVWGWEGVVTSIEPGWVNVKLDSGDRERVPPAVLRVVRPAPDVIASDLRRIRA